MGHFQSSATASLDERFFHGLLLALVALDGYLLIMQAVAIQKLGHVSELANLAESEQELETLSRLKTGVVTAYLAHDLRAQYEAGVVHADSPLQMEGLNGGMLERMVRTEDRAVVFVDEQRLGSNCHAFGMFFKVAKLPLQSLRGRDIVGIHPGVERRARAMKPFVEMRCVPAMLSREDPNPGVAPRETLGRLKRAVG
jgi:hypothetical protein